MPPPTSHTTTTPPPTTTTPTLPLPTIVIPQIGGTIDEVDTTGQFICPTGSPIIRIPVQITGAAKVSASYTIAFDGATGGVSFTNSGTNYVFVLGQIAYKASHTDPKTNTSTVTVTIIAANAQGHSVSAKTPAFTIVGCQPIPR
jgi:hypothetical protein